MAAPSRWMEWLSTYKATATAGPNFAWVLATRALKRMDPIDLSPLRVALNGAEPVDPASVEAFIEAGARHRLRPGAVFPAFRKMERMRTYAFCRYGAVLPCSDNILSQEKT